MKALSNVTIEKCTNESEDDDLKKKSFFFWVFSSNQIFWFINFHRLINEKNMEHPFYDYAYR